MFNCRINELFESIFCASYCLNQKLCAHLNLAVEADAKDLLDPKIANGIRAVRGRRTGNWLTRDETQM